MQRGNLMKLEPFHSADKAMYEPYLSQVLAEMPLSKQKLMTRIKERFSKQFERHNLVDIKTRICDFLDAELQDVNADRTLSKAEVLVHSLGDGVLGVDIRLYSPDELGSTIYGYSMRRLASDEFLLDTYGEASF